MVKSILFKLFVFPILAVFATILFSLAIAIPIGLLFGIGELAEQYGIWWSLLFIPYFGLLYMIVEWSEG